MDLPGQPVDFADVYNSPGSGMNKKSLEPPVIPSYGEARYLTHLWVSRKEEPHEELHQYDSSQSKNMSLEPGAGNIVLHKEIQDKIRATLKLLTFREPHVLVQFWSPRVSGKHQILTTVDQPYGLGVIDERLCLYRKSSECNSFLIDKDREEEGGGPPARAFRRGLPEWMSDVTNCDPKFFPLQDCAVCCNLHGYLALPVFDPTKGLCVGVLELLMSSKYTSFDYEVGQVHRALKKVNLAGPKAFSCPTSMATKEWQNDWDKIFKALKIVCSAYSLPLAQTWAASPSASLVSHEQVKGMSCNSFHTRCVGKFCLSTADLPFDCPDLSMWSYWKACREQHLESSRGVVGRVFSTQGSCYCVDVTKLSEEEYPLVHYARISKLTGCFAIFLQSDNHQYVLEFFLPGHIKDGRYVSSVVQTLKENMVASGFELGDKSSIQVVGPPTDLYVHKEPDIIQTSWNEMGKNFSCCMDSSCSEQSVGDNFSCCMDSSCSEQSVISIAGTDSANVVSPTHTSMENTCAESTDDVEKSNLLKEDRKRKRDSDIVPPVTRKVTVKATFNEIKEEFQFCIPSELSNLENEVAKRFNLMGNMINLKYCDEDNDLVLICNYEDVESALHASRSNGTISLIVKIKV